MIISPFVENTFVQIQHPIFKVRFHFPEKSRTLIFNNNSGKGVLLTQLIICAQSKRNSTQFGICNRPDLKFGIFNVSVVVWATIALYVLILQRFRKKCFTATWCCKRAAICNAQRAILKVSKFQKQFFLFSFEPKTLRNHFLISALASKKRSDQKNEGTLYH